MKKNLFYSINTLNGDKFLDDDYCESLYEYFVMGGEIYNYKININYSDFEKVFFLINENIKLVLSNEEIKKAFLQYVQLIMADAREGKFVDVFYFIQCVDYLGLDILDNSFLKKVKKNVKSIKKSLFSEFSLSKRRK